jgi:hypothetical protein
MASLSNLTAADMGVAVLQAGTPESLTAVLDKWLDEHLTLEVLAVDFQAIPTGTLTVLITYRRDRRRRPAGVQG